MPDNRPNPNPLVQIIEELNRIIVTLGGEQGQQSVQKELSNITLTLGQIQDTQTAMNNKLDAILKAVQAVSQRSAVRLAMNFLSQEKGKTPMALSLPVGQTDKYYINALDANGDPGATLAAGQVIAVVASDPASVVLTPDATPGIDPKTNIQSAASGSVADGPTAVLNTAVIVTATLTAADGVTVLDTETDTVTPLVGTAAKIGILFEDASLNPSPAGAKKK